MHQIAHAFRHSALAMPVLLAVMIGMSGCIVIPYPHHRVLEGSELTAQSLEWLHVNETTRSQVLEKLGSPNIDFIDQHVVAYAWSGLTSKVFSASSGGAGSNVLGRMRRALLVRFDSGGRVAAFSIINRPTKLIPYDALDQPRNADLDDWRVILGKWLSSQTSAKR